LVDFEEVLVEVLEDVALEEEAFVEEAFEGALVEEASLFGCFDFDDFLCRLGQFGSRQTLPFRPSLSALWSTEPQPDDKTVCTSEVVVEACSPLTLCEESALRSVTCVRLEYPESLARSGMARVSGTGSMAGESRSLPRPPERLAATLACLRVSWISPSSEL
jgi:hypothetical protein